jgi:hypothetical protein
MNKAETTGKAVAICRLPTGDMIVTMDKEEDRICWLKAGKWLALYGEGARIKRRQFSVIAHRIRVNQVQGQERTIMKIYKQNPRLKEHVEILHVTFTNRLLKSGRLVGPLIILVAEPEQANRLVDAGLIWQYELHDCEPYEGECAITQCFKCYQYGHVARFCRNTARCGFCAAPGHATNDCMAKEEPAKHRYVNCRMSHCLWARECSARKGRAEAARIAYKNRPLRF